MEEMKGKEKENFCQLYCQICLSEVQKKRLKDKIEKENNEQHNLRPAFYRAAIAGICMILLGNVTIYAAKACDLPGRMKEIYEWIAGREIETEESEIYEKYGEMLGQKITLPNGTLWLDAILYDNNYAYIAYTYQVEDRLQTTGELSFRLNGEEGSLSVYRYYHYKEQSENGIKGYYILSGKDLKQGDEISIWNQKEEYISSLTLKKDLSSLVLELEDENQPLPEGVSKVRISALSISLEGVTEKFRLPYKNITVVSKNGKIIPFAKTGSGGSYDSDFNFSTSYNFETPTELSEIDYILFETNDGETELPINID